MRKNNSEMISAADEIGHVHADISGGWLRAGVFGAMDGLVTNLALVAGVGAASESADIVVVTGVAGLVAGAFSMALGEYASVGAQNEALGREVGVEREEIARHPEAEKAELAQAYRDMGLSAQTARTVAEEVHSQPDLAVRVHITQELGVDPTEQPSPWTAAASSFVCFAVGGLLPLIPFLLGSASLAVGMAVGGVGLFVLGALTARFTVRAWWLAGLRQLAFGAIAAGATYVVGALIGVSATG